MLLFAAAAGAAAASPAAAAGVCYHSSAAALAPGLLAIMLSISILSHEFSLFLMCYLPLFSCLFRFYFAALAVLCNYTCLVPV